MSNQQQIAFVVLGTIFLFLGIGALIVAAARGLRSRMVLVWFGVFSTMYGVRLFAEAPPVFALLAGSISTYARDIVWGITYLILIPALLFWAELSLGSLRRFFRIMVAPVCLIAIAGLVSMIAYKSPTRFMRYNSVLVICLLLVLAIPNVLPWLGKKYLAIQSWVLAVGTLVLAIAVIHDNLGSFLPLRNYSFLEPLALAMFVFSQGWVAAEKIFTDERRLLAVENELAIAREIQTSILPSGVPELAGLRIGAAYSPMTAVAGDFYWFIVVDKERAGFLVADVSGHGVPAALIASMIKVAMQVILPYAEDPRAVLRELGRTLSGQLRGQFVSAAYLWIDAERRAASYSAAGHPPLFLWRANKLERIESNGLLFGVLPDCDDYPVREIPVKPGDRFLLYTDGIIEAENAKGEPFGDYKLEAVIRQAEVHKPPRVCDELLSEVRSWVPGSMMQQDDITLVVIDVV